MLESYRITDLEQVRILADPLKLRILRSLAEGPKTTRVVARELGENLTRLYRHVDALRESGLIELISERRKRGTVERTFQAIAQRFEVEQSLFATDDGNEAIRALFRAGEDEMMNALGMAEGDMEPLCMRLQIEASPEQLERLRTLLEEWLESAQTLEEPGEETAKAGALIAFYPLSQAD